MKVLVFGAGGRVGKLVVDLALERGHTVSGFVRFGRSLHTLHPNLTEIQGDVYRSKTISSAIAGHDAVISTLGCKVTGGPFVCRDAMETIITAMKRHKVSRLIALSAFGASEHKNFDLYTMLLRFAIPHIMRDKDEMETLIKASNLDWTIIRPAAYADFWPRKSYRAKYALINLFPLITRSGVAQCLVDQLEGDVSTRQTLAIEGAK